MTRPEDSVKLCCMFLLVFTVPLAVGHPHGACSGSGCEGGSGTAEAEAEKAGGDCFPGDAVVMTREGKLQVQALLQNPRAEVQVVDKNNNLVFSPIRLWLHVSNGSTNYLEIQTETGEKLTTSKTHFVFRVPCSGGHREAVFAERLKNGDCVLITRNNTVVMPDRITAVLKTTKAGRYQFTTTTGTVVVDNVVASTYSIIDNSDLQHYVFTGLYYIQQVANTLFSDSILFTMDNKNSFADMFYQIFYSETIF